MRINIYSLISRFVTLLLLCCVALTSHANTRVLDRIEVNQGEEENVITVHFNVPVRYVSHIVNEARSEANIQLQLTPTRDVDIQDLVQTDQLSWNPSAEIPLDRVVFRGRLVGTSSLLVSFASPVAGIEIREGRDFYIVEFVLKKPKKVVKVPLPEPPDEVPIEPKPPVSIKQLPPVIYVINLSSQVSSIDLSQIAPIPLSETMSLYTMEAMVDGRPWYRLRLGFFRTMTEAKAQLKEVRNFYPKAWIDRADIEERRRAMQLPEGKGQPPIVEKPDAGLPDQEKLGPEDQRLAKMIELTRRTMTAGEYAKATRMLEAILEEPENAFTQEARELLGLARERNGQIAHAKAEYRAYIERYPEGEDNERVKQRLLGLVTATQKPRESLRKETPAEQQKRGAEWELYGSLSQNYRRGEIDSPFVDEEDSISRSEIETFVDINSRRRGQDYDMRMKLTGSYIYDMLDDSDGDYSTLSDAYLDLEHRESHSNLRLGRQRLRSSGVLNRFDGLVLGYEMTPDVQVRAVAGLPVERSKDVFLHESKAFAGISGDIANIFENWDLSLYLIEQRVDELVDRRAVGGEIRYFDPSRSLFSLVDYDFFFGALNTFMLQGNWTLQDQTRLFMNLDYRKSPVLLTSNALAGQSDPDTLFPILTIEELRQYYLDDEIYDLVKDRTAQTKTISIGASRPLLTTLSVSGDITVTNTGDTPESGGVEATEGTGNEYYYALQVTKNDLLKQGDIGIFSVRYSDTNTSNTLRMTMSSRYPITNFWRVNPKFSVSYRENQNDEGNRLNISPFIQMDYRVRKSFTLEMEAGMNWFEEDDGHEITNFTDYFVLAGYRWDF